MKNWLQLLVGMILLCSGSVLYAQETQAARAEFDLKGSVKVKGSLDPIPNAQVQIFGYRNERTNSQGEFRIRARIGDELVISHPSFETVFYTLKSEEDVDIRVEGFTEEDVANYAPSRSKKELKSTVDRHRQYIDSANFYKSRNIDKSILFVENSIKALGKRVNKEKAAISYTTLGDIYNHWSQFDLALSSYENAIRYNFSVERKAKLGKAQLANGNIEAAIATFTELRNQRNLSDYYRVIAYEGLGDAFTQQKNYTSAQEQYRQGLTIAKNALINPKVTDLTAKLGAVLERQGQVQEAKGVFKSTLDLAENESPQRSLQQKETVADFYNRANLYDEEIALRKEALEEIEDLDDQVPIKSAKAGVIYDSITPQKINYKIGTSYLQQRRLEEAIPYLQNSIQQAREVSDLAVQKDATRRISEVFETQGDFTKALKAYQDYVALVDELYLQKEQQISQVSRFSRDLANMQNRISSLEKERELSESKLNLVAAEQELVQESNKLQKLIIFGLGFGVLLLSLALFFLYRSAKQEKLTNNLLALRSMRSQMNPHFIFNALNSVNNYIAVNDERNANRYLSEFSTLMRSVLENSEEDFIPLSKEIELLKLYTKLEHARFEDKFDYEITIADSVDIEDFVIPPMLLQPYVENAVWHGLRYKKEKGMLKIAMEQISKDAIRITIEDNGIGRQKSKALKTEHQRKQRSTGMSNIKKRIAILNKMYKDKIDVLIEDVSVDGEGTRVQLTLKKD